MMADVPADRELIQRHRDDALRGFAFVYEKPDGTLTLDNRFKHVSTLDLEIWFAYLLRNGEAEICPGVIASLQARKA